MGCTSSTGAQDQPGRGKAKGHGIALKPSGIEDAEAFARLTNHPPARPGVKVDAYEISPGFVVKAVRERSSDKIFVNIFQADELFDEGIVVRAAESADHRGQPCSVYPVLLSSECVSKTQTDVHYLEQVVLQVLRRINREFPECSLETNTVKLPKIKKGYVGDDMQVFTRNLPVHTLVFNGQGLRLDDKDDDQVSVVSHQPFQPQRPTPTPAQVPPASTVVAVPTPAAVPIAGATATTAAGSLSPPVSVSARAAEASRSTAAAPTAASSKVVGSAASAPSVVAPTAHAPVTVPVAASSPSSVPVTTPATVTAAATPTPVAAAPAPVRESPSPFPSYPPPKMAGWLQKRGHLVKNWKTRHFVLNQGFVIYYTDASDKEPFGEGAKGMLCLAGYRDKIQARRDSTAATAPNDDKARRSSTSGFFGSRGNQSELRIHLEVDAASVKAMLPDHSDTKKIFEAVLRKTQAAVGLSRSSESTAELLIECGTMGEKLAWTAAIEAHTLYVEEVLRTHASHNTLDVAPYIDPLRFFSDMPPPPVQVPAPDSVVTAAAPSPAVDAGVPVAPDALISFSAPTEVLSAPAQAAAQAAPSLAVDRRPSVTFANDKPLLAPSVASRSTSSSRSMSMVGKNNKFLHLMTGDEQVQMAGMVSKSGTLGMGLLCDLVLVVNKNLDHDASVPSMRLLVVDSNSYKLDSEIVWKKDGARPTVMAAKPVDKHFMVKDTHGRTYKFSPKDKICAFEWATAIDALAM